MADFTGFLGSSGIFIMLLLGMIWLCSVNDMVARIAGLFFLAVWFISTVGGPLAVAVFFYIPKHEYMPALLTEALATFFYITMWRPLGWPSFKNSIRNLGGNPT